MTLAAGRCALVILGLAVWASAAVAQGAAAVASPTPSSGNEAIVRAACRPPERCVKGCAGQDREHSYVTYVQRGAFTAPGAEEALVSLFPCGEEGSRREAGTLALLRLGIKGWRRVAAISDAIFNEECRLQHAPERELLFCQAGVQAMGGILIDSLCAIFWNGKKIVEECPVRVMDVTASGCLANNENDRRRTWAGNIVSWAEKRFGDRPAATVDIDFAIEAVGRQQPDRKRHV
jgi:hypothetical protein